MRTVAALAGLPRSLLVPRHPDRRFLAGLDDVGIPEGDVEVTVQALPQVPRPVPGRFVVEAMARPRAVGYQLTSFVVRHPEATFLVDPGVCVDVVDRAIVELPPLLRRAVLPPPDVLGITESLDRAGIRITDIAFALPTHLHWDHVAGLLDLPGLPVMVRTGERAWIGDRGRPPVGGVRLALSGRPETRYELDGPPVLTFERSHDLFGDGAVILVELAGHTPGSVGVLLRTAAGPVLLCGDAAWHHRQVEMLRQKTAYPGGLADEDRDQTFRVLHRLHAVRDRVRIVPTHDDHAAAGIPAVAGNSESAAASCGGPEDE